ncbi:MAG: hypothetical protein WAU75_06335 [Solirubrobacteraceae bacterium]
MIILAVVTAALSGAVGAGMTVLGLAAVGFTVVAMWGDSQGLVPSGSLGPRTRRLIWLAGGACLASLLVAMMLFFVHVSNTAAFVAAFALALVFGGVALSAVLR